GGERPVGAGVDAQAGEQGAGGGVGGPGNVSNVLVDRFMADADFAALYEAKTAELTEQLYASGTADEVIANWSDLLTNDAGTLVSEETVSTEAAALVTYIDGVR
ncbi:MAG: hypothetical protein WBG76_05475, partial [Ornithinimicrobium sp.]